jgi:hypothetical protein
MAVAQESENIQELEQMALDTSPGVCTCHLPLLELLVCRGDRAPRLVLLPQGSCPVSLWLCDAVSAERTLYSSPSSPLTCFSQAKGVPVLKRAYTSHADYHSLRFDSGQLHCLVFSITLVSRLEGEG